MSRRIPRFMVPPEMEGLYHVISRVVDRQMFFGEGEKQRFRELSQAYAEFSGIQIVAWCLMDNHFHLLLRVPPNAAEEAVKLGEEEILRRLRLIYRENQVAEIERVLGQCNTEESRRRILEVYTKRMGDLAMYMRTLKQRFSRWYNWKHERRGTLWEDRYKSVLVESEGNSSLGHAARVVAAYIDLNPVRAGMVEDPKDYGWCGYAKALVGEKVSEEGIQMLWGPKGGIKGALAEHRLFLFKEGSEERIERTNDGQMKDRRGGKKTRVGIDPKKVWAERRRGGRLPLEVFLRLKSRYLVDGAIIGSAEFLRRVTGASAGLRQDGPDESADVGTETDDKRVRGGRKMRFAEWGGLHALRNLRVGVVG